MTRIAVVQLLGIGLLVAGCNNGGPAPPPMLTLTSQLPPAGSIVGLDATVVVVFDREPDVATLTATGMRVHDGAGPLPGSLAYEAPTRTWTWTPDRELPRGALLTVTIDESVRGSDGARLPIGHSWSFRARAGVPDAVVTIANQAVVTTGVFVDLFPDTFAVVVTGSQFWEIGPLGVGSAGLLPVGIAQGLHTDAAGQAAVFGYMLGTPGSAPIIASSRWVRDGLWSEPTVVGNTLAGSPLGGRLSGNERGDLLIHVRHGFSSPTFVRHRFYWSSAADPNSWLLATEAASSPAVGMMSSIAASGEIATLGIDGDFVIAERHHPGLGTASIHTVAHGAFFRAEAMASSADGTLRAVWQEPGVTRQSFAGPGAAFEPPSTIPVAIPNGSNWRSAPTGAIFGWYDTLLFRSEAGSAEWSDAALAAEPLAVAMSPRGEVALLYFDLPDQLMLVRWRAGEPIDPPQSIATVTSPFAAFRDGAVAIDDGGRVFAVFVADVPADLIGIRVE